MSRWEGLNPPYSTIVVDPPWQARGNLSIPTRVGRVKKDRRAEAHYSTLTGDEIRALPVGDLADPMGAHIYLWTTNVDLPLALSVMEAWGFTYKTLITWVKEGNLGLGYWFRTQTEHVLFGVRGTLATIANDQRNVFTAAKSGHSVKPAAFADIVERMSPGPYVELFARQPRLGWDSWGYGYEQIATGSTP